MEEEIKVETFKPNSSKTWFETLYMALARYKTSMLSNLILAKHGLKHNKLIFNRFEFMTFKPNSSKTWFETKDIFGALMRDFLSNLILAKHGLKLCIVANS